METWLKNGALDLGAAFFANKDRPALLMDGEAWTYSRFQARLEQVMATLRELGVEPGSRVGLHQTNSPLHLLLMISAFFLDFVFVALDSKAPAASLPKGIDLDFLFVSERTRTRARVFSPSIFDEDPGRGGNWISRRTIPFSREVSLILTSGSTGQPKGIVHTAGAFYYSALGTNQFYGISPKDRWLISLPFNHIGGRIIFMRTFLAGASAVLPNSLKDMETAIIGQKPTVISLVPTQLQRLCESSRAVKQLRCCKAILLGGAPSPPWLLERALDLGLPISATYGCTEACSQVTAVEPGASRSEHHTAGKPLPFRSIRLQDNRVLEIGGSTLMKYAVEDGEKTFPVKDGFFATSDMAQLDNSGNLVFLGRSDQVFVSGGENIHPQEIEDALLAIDDVLTAIVVPCPDPDFGMVATAFVDSPHSEERLKGWLREKLPGYKVPKKIWPVVSGEKSGAIKLSRKALAQKARELAGME